MQTVKKGGSVLGKRPSVSSVPRPNPTSSNNGTATLNTVSAGKRKDRQHVADTRSREESRVVEQDEDDDDEERDGAHDADSSSDSDNADITIDINTKQQQQQHTKKHKPNSHNSTTNATTTTTDNDIINVEFGLFDPLPDDDFTYRMLLKDYLPEHIKLPERPGSGSGSGSGGLFALHEFCGLISGQVEVGTTIKADGTDEPLGVITALPLPPLQNAPLPLYQLHSYLSSHVPAAYRARLSALFSSTSHNVLLVQSRLLNTPTALIGPLHTALIEDVQWAATNSSSAHSHNPWHIDRVLLLGRCVKAGGGVSGGRRGGGGGGLDVWVRFEEEWYERESEWSCRWAVPYRSGRSGSEEGGGESELEERREGQTAVLMCLTWEKVKLVVAHIQTMMKDA